jgi:hypothetical protein
LDASRRPRERRATTAGLGLRFRQVFTRRLILRSKAPTCRRGSCPRPRSRSITRHRPCFRYDKVTPSTFRLYRQRHVLVEEENLRTLLCFPRCSPPGLPGAMK